LNHEAHKEHEEGKHGKMGMKVESVLPLETEELAQLIMGCAIAAHRELGPGCLENLYQRAVQVEWRSQGIPFECEKEIMVKYREQEFRVSAST
jgi:hypothetical protein